MIPVSEKRIEDYINKFLTGDAHTNALGFVAYLRANEMEFERYNKGYWEGKLYWRIKYKSETVYYVLINSSDDTVPWIIWSDDSATNSFENSLPNEQMKEIAWKNVDICRGNKCGGCNLGTGTPKTIFGKGFDSVCGTLFRFDNPDALAVECTTTLMDIRKSDILNRERENL